MAPHDGDAMDFRGRQVCRGPAHAPGRHWRVGPRGGKSDARREDRRRLISCSAHHGGVPGTNLRPATMEGQNARMNLQAGREVKAAGFPIGTRPDLLTTTRESDRVIPESRAPSHPRTPPTTHRQQPGTSARPGAFKDLPEPSCPESGHGRSEGAPARQHAGATRRIVDCAQRDRFSRSIAVSSNLQ